MTSRDFCFWLQGYIELADPDDGGLTSNQLRCVSRHLALVFKHEIDPSVDGSNTTTKAEYDKLHHAVSQPIDSDSRRMRC